MTVAPEGYEFIIKFDELPEHTGVMPVTSTVGEGLIVTLAYADSIPQSLTTYAVYIPELIGLTFVSSNV